MDDYFSDLARELPNARFDFGTPQQWETTSRHCPLAPRVLPKPLETQDYPTDRVLRASLRPALRPVHRANFATK